MDNAIIQQKNGIQLDDFQLKLALEVLEQLNEYNQSALEVMTSGGKSYIAAYIMMEYINSHRSARILWIAPRSAINNVKNKIFDKTALRNRINYVGYEELSRGNVPDETEIEFDDVALIVFDECHKAYAKKTFKYLSQLLSKLESADRLAMSATPIRYGGQNTFNILVPNVPNHIQFDINDAAEHDLLPGLCYVLANRSICSSDFKSLERYKKLASKSVEAEEIYREVMETLSSFQFDLKKDLGEMLRNYIKTTGDSGERHIAFLPSIASIKEMKPSIEAAFNSAYPKCNINILEYHSGVSDEENAKAFNQFVVEEPEANRIDVMLSVDKATESIHPDNIRSVLMFRGTQSIRIYLQQMGRGLMLKSYHPEDIVIFDFADNVSCVNGVQTIYTGNKSPENRGIISSGTEYVNSIDDIKYAIMRKFGYKKGLETKVGLARIKECMDNLRKIERLARISWLETCINKAYRIQDYLVKKEAIHPDDNIHHIIHSIIEEVDLEQNLRLDLIWKKDNDKKNCTEHWERVLKTFTTYQKIYLGNGVDITPKLKEYFDSLGYAAYLESGNGNLSVKALRDIDYIKDEMDKCGGDLSESKNTNAKHKLKQIRLQYARGMFTSNISVYAQRKGIDINIYNLSNADLATLCDTDGDRDIFNAFKPIFKILASKDKDIQEGGDIVYEDWMQYKVKLTLVYKQYRDKELAHILFSYLLNKYDYIINAYKLSDDESENGAKLISAVFKINSNEIPNRVEEDYIFNHSGLNNMSDYEIQILKELGINKQRYASSLEDKTQFMIDYNLAMGGDNEAIKKMLGYDRDKLDQKRRKLLNTTKFRQVKNDVKDTLGAEVLLRKAKTMCIETEDYSKTIEEISSALKSEVIQQLDVAITPFRAYEADLAKEVVQLSDEEFNNMVNDTQVNPLSILIIRCREKASCSKDVISNILKVSALDKNYKNRLESIRNLIIQ